jgi:8-oxo-dGTP pyrophosphatase MutT (NUDIX family)
MIKEPKAWITTSSQVAFDGGWVKVRADECLSAEGTSISPYYVIEAADYVHVAALTNAGELVMVRQYRQGTGQSHLELPAGIIEPTDVDAVAAGKRELREETGYEAPDWRLLHVWHANPARMANRQMLLLATGAARSMDAATDGVESLNSGVVALPAVRAAIAHGRIDSALHVASILRVLMEISP